MSPSDEYADLDTPGRPGGGGMAPGRKIYI